MQLRLQSWVILLAVLCVPALALCQDGTPSPIQLRIAAIDQIVTEQMKQQQIVGVAIGVMLDGKIGVTKGYGFADLEQDQPVSTETVFNWASNSKPVMAVAALQLVQQGLLDLDADVRKYVPEFPEKEQVITVRHLLCHQSGIPHYANGRVRATTSGSPDPASLLDPVAGIHVFCRSPLLFQPGEKYSYSSYGYILLSAVVQRAGQAPIAEQLEKRIIAPLELNSFQLDLADTGQPNWSLAYAVDAHGKQSRVPDRAHFWKHGAGGYKSNVVDFAKWAAGLLNSKLVTKETEQLMWTVQATLDGKPTTYGLGFNARQRDGIRQISHGGSQEETKTYLVLEPETKSGVVVMCNSARGKPALIATAILDEIGAIGEH